MKHRLKRKKKHASPPSQRAAEDISIGKLSSTRDIPKAMLTRKRARSALQDSVLQDPDVAQSSLKVSPSKDLLIPEVDGDEYQVEIEENSRHRTQGHLHMCGHGDHESDGSGEDSEVSTCAPNEDWEHEQDDEEEAVHDTNAEDTGDEKGDGGLVFCDLCQERQPFDEFNATQRLDLPPVPEWVIFECPKVMRGEYRFCLRHSNSEQKAWVLHKREWSYDDEERP